MEHNLIGNLEASLYLFPNSSSWSMRHFELHIWWIIVSLVFFLAYKSGLYFWKSWARLQWNLIISISHFSLSTSPKSYNMLLSDFMYLFNFFKLTPVRADLIFTGMEPSAQWKPTRADSSTKDDSPSPSNCLVLTASQWNGMMGFWLAWSCAHNRGTSYMTVSNMPCVEGDCPLDHTLFSFPLSWLYCGQ